MALSFDLASNSYSISEKTTITTLTTTSAETVENYLPFRCLQTNAIIIEETLVKKTTIIESFTKVTSSGEILEQKSLITTTTIESKRSYKKNTMPNLFYEKVSESTNLSENNSIKTPMLAEILNWLNNEHSLFDFPLKNDFEISEEITKDFSGSYDGQGKGIETITKIIRQDLAISKKCWSMAITESKINGRILKNSFQVGAGFEYQNQLNLLKSQFK